MSKFWLGILVLGVIAVGFIIFAEKPSSEQAEPTAVQVKAPKPVEEPAAKALEPLAMRAQEDDFGFEDVRAQQLYQMAEAESKIARKPMMTYGRMVNYCREIIRDFPESSYADKARELLRQMPDRRRKQFKITDEEIGL